MFQWNPKREKAAIALANGATRDEAAQAAGVSVRTVYLWLENDEFDAEVDRLSLMTDIAGKAERLRIAKRVIRQKINEDGVYDTDRDLLDWLKFAQSETDGIRLDLAALSEAASSVADRRQD